jgi:hypothetical protein
MGGRARNESETVESTDQLRYICICIYITKYAFISTYMYI